MNLTLAEIADCMGDRLQPAIPIRGWSIDSRTVQPGEFYIALHGERLDGHAFLPEAAARGACGALVDAKRISASLPLIHCQNTLQGTQALASLVRERLGGDVIGITGSAGKTSTKDAVAHLLGAGIRVEKNAGNLNNHIGVPLSILRFEAGADAYVLEMGMNHAGEILALSAIARPAIAIVTNVGTAHLENFESIEAIALAKRELVDSLPHDGTAILNADDKRVAQFPFVGRTLTYGIEMPADYRAENLELLPDGAWFTVHGTVFHTPLGGRHSVLNLLAGVACGELLGVSLDAMAARSATLRPGKMRGERFERSGMVIYNDSYNSNPEAAKAMLDLLAAQPARRRIAVLGEMRELGAWSVALHKEVGEHAARMASIVVGICGAAADLAATAREHGVEALYFESPEDAGEALRGIAREGDVLLFKGSRGTHVEKALERFLA